MGEEVGVMGEPTQLDRIEAMLACICVKLEIDGNQIYPTAMLCRDRRVKQLAEAEEETLP